MSASSVAAGSAAPPARGLLDGPALPWLLVGFGLVSLYGSGDLAAALRTLRLPDTDDAMRLVAVRDLVAGQSWFDLVQHRFLPPQGVASHWSRLVDAPLAAGIAGLTPLLGAGLAERLTTALWPPLLFLAYALALHRGMGRLLSPRAAVLALFAATQTIPLTMQFAPGRIDHHNVQILLMLGLGLGLMAPVRTWRTGAFGGLLAALSLAVGLEALPVIAAAGLVLALDWWRSGDPALGPLLGFGMGLSLCAGALFLVQTAPALWSTGACDALSPPWLQLAGTGAALALAAALLRPGSKAARLGLILGVGALGLAGFAALFPACLHGPFPDMPDLVRRDWLERVREMQPFAAMLRDHPAEALAFAACLFAATPAAAILAAAERDGARRRVLAVTGLLLAIGTAQTLFQLRGVYVASAFVPLVAGLCLDRALAVSGGTVSPKARAALLAGALALNAQVWLVSGRLLEAAIGRGGQDAAQAARQERCSEAAALSPLDALPAGTVLAPIDLGPYLLVHTRHAVVAAPYHRASAGLAAGIAVARGDEAALRREAGLTGATYLALCPGAAPDGAGSSKDESFAGRLARGNAGAAWLEPLTLPSPDGALKVWRIR